MSNYMNENNDMDICNATDTAFDRCYSCMKKIKPGTVFCKYCGYNQKEPAAKGNYLTPGSKLDGQILKGQYIIGKVLGAGGFGVTYMAWDTNLSRKVAIKEYLPIEFATRMSGASTLTVFTGEKAKQFEIGRAKFQNEGQRLAKCQNVSGVVQIYDVLYQNHTAYLVMEYLDGETLKSKLDRETSLSVEDALGIIIPVLDALEEVHKHGLIHRDVAPDNIFLCKNGAVKLIDFGAARYATTGFSRSLSVILKSGYSPEEQYRNKGEQGPWTDVYAAGATLYKMLTGMTPPDAMERTANDELRSSVGLPGWVVTVDRKYRYLKGRLAHHLYRYILRKDEEKTEDSDQTARDIASERRRNLAYHTYQKLTGNSPDVADDSRESYAASEKIDAIPRPVYIAMMNALNVDQNDRTQSAAQFKKELTGEAEANWLVIKNRKIDIGAFPRWMKAVGALAAAVVVLLIVSLFSVIMGAASDEVEIPEIINHMTDEAKDIIIEKDLEYMIVDARVSDKVTENKVMFQEPEQFTKVEKGSVVKATISMGTEKVTVPNFIGMTREEAEQELSRLQLTGEFSEEYSSVGKGKICRQDQEVNARVPVGSVLNLAVSLGLEEVDKKETVSVPNITGLTLQEAKNKLKSINLYLDVKSEKYADKPAGTVISQSVKSGSTVKQGTTIKVVVSKGKKTVVVPYVTYKTKNEAIRLLENVNLKYAIKYDYHESVAKGNVISQSVAAEKSVAPGTTIDLVVSKGKKTVTVPNVEGSKFAAAKNKIEEKGLKVTVKEETSDSVEKGIVIRQSPAAKKEVANGATVTIYVSKGKKATTTTTAKTTAITTTTTKSTAKTTKTTAKTTTTSKTTTTTAKTTAKTTTTTTNAIVKVPNVEGKTSSNAKKAIKSMNLKVDVKNVYSYTVPEGTVIEQFPPANTSVNRGDTVTITVSQGEKPLTVPDVEGETVSDAKELIRSCDLKPDVVKEYSDTVASGKVIRQNPPANSSAQEGDTVTITVSKGRRPVKVPNVVGKSLSDANNTLEAAGLRPTYKLKESDEVPEDCVISQSPVGGASAYQNDTVTIVISSGSSR